MKYNNDNQKVMIQQPSNQWTEIIQKQMAEKISLDKQEKQDFKQRQQKFKEELETDIKLRQQKKIIQHQQDSSLESELLESLRQKESQKLKEFEVRKMKQIENSLENLNHLLVRKKMNQERSYQSLLVDSDEVKQERLKELKSLERQKIMKEEDKKNLRNHYDDILQSKLHSKKQIKSQLLHIQETDPDLVQNKIFKDSQNYQDDLNKQLEQKKRKLIELQMKKQEERLRVEQKLAFEKQKMQENKIKDYHLHRQYEVENYEVSKDRKQIAQSNSLEPYDIRLQENKNQSKLPHIYPDNYQPLERNKQLQLLDQDLNKYKQQQYQWNQSYNPDPNSNQILKQNLQQTPLKTPISQSSQQSKQSKQSKNQINLIHQDGPGYSQIHQSKIQTPKSKQSKKSLQHSIEHDSPIESSKPKFKNHNILNGLMHQ